MADVGIKETKEIVVAVFALAKVLVKPLKDGFQAGKDLEAIVESLLEDKSLSEKIKAAIEGAPASVAELQDVGVLEGLEFARLLLAEGKAIAAEFKSTA